MKHYMGKFTVPRGQQKGNYWFKVWLYAERWHYTKAFDPYAFREFIVLCVRICGKVYRWRWQTVDVFDGKQKLDDLRVI